MNKNLKEAIFKQKIRKIHKDVLKKPLMEQEHSLYSTFIQPFTDVIDAAKLTGQDILNSLRLSFDLLTTISAKKKAAAIDKFDKRKSKIEEKWKPIVERNQEAMANADLDILALAFAPAAYITSEAAVAAYKKADSIHDYLVDSGWRIPLVSTILGRPPEDIGPGSGKDRDPAASTDKPEEKKSILGRLASLFYIESSWHAGELIVEQDKQDKKEPDLKKALKKYFDQTGLSSQFEKSADELLETYDSLLGEIMEETMPKLKLSTALLNANNVDDFETALNIAAGEGLDLQASGIDQVKQGVIDAAEKLAQSDEFKEKTAKEAGMSVNEAGASVEDLPNDKLETAAMRVAFVNAKQNVDEKLGTGKNKLKGDSIEWIDEMLPNEQSLSVLKTTKNGLKFLKRIEDAKQKIQNS